MLSAIARGLRQIRRDCHHHSDYLLAGRCILCGGAGQSGLDLCRPCKDALPVLAEHCRYCALPLATPNVACGECLTNPPPFSHTEAYWLYQFPVAQLLGAFKYRRKYSYGQTLGQLMAQRLATRYAARPRPDMIAAVPLHWRRHWRRGFNQSELLAKLYARELNIRLFHGLKRSRYTRNQQSLNAVQRKQNLRKAFQLSGETSIADQRIALVDDIMTTGATAREVSQTLLNAGAAEVHVWVLARTPH